MTRRFTSFIPFALLSLWLTPLLLSGCSSLIYEDLEECPQGVDIDFYHLTPCMSDTVAVGEVEGLYLFAFDISDRLVAMDRVEGRVDLSEGYRMELPPAERGEYSLIAWTGLSEELFELRTPVVGTTTKDDLLLTLRSQGGTATSLGESRVGRGEIDAPVYLPDRKDFGTVYAHAAINMLEVTNRLRLTLRLDESACDILDIDDFELSIYSANRSALLNGAMPLGAEPLKYPGSEVARDDTSLTMSYTTMALRPGYSNLLKIYNTREEKSYFSEDLLGRLLLENPNVNLDCTHDFDIEMVIEDTRCPVCPDNNLVMHIFINNYQIHSFALELTNRY